MADQIIDLKEAEADALLERARLMMAEMQDVPIERRILIFMLASILDEHEDTLRRSKGMVEAVFGEDVWKQQLKKPWFRADLLAITCESMRVRFGEGVLPLMKKELGL